jgi:hypothetical protein
MSNIEIYEYRFVATDFVGEPDKPWEHIGVLLAASHPHKTWTDDEIRPVVDSIAALMEQAAARWEAHAKLCAPDHKMPAHDITNYPDSPTGASPLFVARACEDLTRKQALAEPWCEYTARRTRGCCRTPERPMLVRIHVDSISTPSTSSASGA